MMNSKKKGDLQVEPIVILAIAIAVLALVGLGFFIYSDKEIAILKYLPDFNITKQQGEVLETIGYDIANNKMAYYNGNEWADFPQQTDVNDLFVLGNKKLSAAVLTDTLAVNFWYNKSLRGSTTVYELKDSDINVIYPFEYYNKQAIVNRVSAYQLGKSYFVSDNVRVVPNLNAVIFGMPRTNIDDRNSAYDITQESQWSLYSANSLTSRAFQLITQWWVSDKYYVNRGDVTVALLNKAIPAEALYGLLIVGREDSLKFVPLSMYSMYESFDSESSNMDRTKWKLQASSEILSDPVTRNLNGAPYSTIRDSAIAWRDSVLKNPIQIPYTDVKNNAQLTSEYYCVQKVSGYLTVNLLKPVSKTTECKQ